MDPLELLISRLPRGDDPVAPAEPRPLPTEELMELLREVDGRRGGWRDRIVPRLDHALATRLVELGEPTGARSPWLETQCFLPGEAVDVFTGRMIERQDLNPAERTLRAAAWARAASEVLHESREEWEGRTLSTIRREGGRCVVERLQGTEPPAIGVIDRDTGWLLPSPAGRSIAELAKDWGTALATGRFQRMGSRGLDFLHAPMVVVTDRRSLGLARHAHRTGGLQGPWGCLSKSSRSASAPPLELLGGSTAVLDLEAQAELMVRISQRVDELLDTVPDGTFQELGRSLTRSYVDCWRPREWGFDRLAGTGPREELVVLEVDSLGGIAELVHAVGVAWLRTGVRQTTRELNGAETLSPPMLLAARSEGSQEADLAVATAVRFRGDQPEPLAEFSTRLQQQTERERSGRGPVGDSLRKAVGQSAPPQLRARLFRALWEGVGPIDGPLDWLRAASPVQLIDWAETPAIWPLFSGATPSVATSGSACGGGMTVVAHSSPRGAIINLHLGGELAARKLMEIFVDELRARL